MKKIVILISFDDVYFKFGKTLLYSLEKWGIGIEKKLYSVNLAENKRRELYERFSNITILNKKIYLPKGRYLRSYMANRKASVFLDAVNRYPANIYIYLDADMLMRDSVDNLLKDLGEGDVALLYRPSANGAHAKINSSIVIVKSGKGINLIREWNKQMKSRFVIFTSGRNLSIIDILKNKKQGYPKPLYVIKGGWFWDQITLYEAIKVLPLQYSTLSVDKYLNGDFAPCASIWSGHHQNKNYVYERYTSELRRYDTAIF
ncbi:MAG: hypothetical protein ACYDFU_06870 [Nitrospirota bacterium]